MTTSDFELEPITKALIKGQANWVKTLTILAIKNGIDSLSVIDKAQRTSHGKVVIGYCDRRFT